MLNIQDYRDFGENLGKYAVGNTDVNVYTTDGLLAGTLNFPMPDFGVSASQRCFDINFLVWRTT